MALIVLDASVVIAHLDPADPHHAAARAALSAVEGDDLRLPASAYSEALVDPARRDKLEQARLAVEALQLTIEPVDAGLAEQAAFLRARHAPLRLPDALVIACGEILGADRVITADHRWRRFGPRIDVIG